MSNSRLESHPAWDWNAQLGNRWVSGGPYSMITIYNYWLNAATKRISDLKCGRPIRNRTKLISVTGVVGGGLAFLAFTLRMIARLPLFKGGPFGMDDAMIVIAMVSSPRWLRPAICMIAKRDTRYSQSPSPFCRYSVSIIFSEIANTGRMWLIITFK